LALLVEQNAKQAWQWWLFEKAPTKWLDQYWASHSSPWLDPRLSEAERYRIKYQLSEEFRISERLRRQINKQRKRDGVAEIIRGAIRRNGGSKYVEKALGYSIAEMKRHLELQFTRGMNWEKFMAGEIHIDHIVPQADFDLTDDDEWRRCWCLSNLRPLWAKDNLKKGAKLEVML
jgi:hypothetical protein